MRLAQGHNTVTPVGIELGTSRFGVRRSYPLSIKHAGILIVLIMGLFVVELYFFFMNFRERAADIVP